MYVYMYVEWDKDDMGSMLLQINNDRLISPNVHSIHKMMNDPMLICNMKPHLKC